MPASEPFVIVGASLSGAKAAEALRAKGYDGRIVLVGDEEHRPYERPPLSKDYLIGKSEREKAFVHPESWYAEHDVELRLGSHVSAIDRASHQIRLADATRLEYAKLLLATGASPRHLPVLGGNADRVLYLRTIDDSERLRALFGQIQRLVVIGAGWIGLEATAAARGAGVEVTVVETAELPLLRVLGPEMGRHFAELHRRNGVEFRFGEIVNEITTEGGYATGVRLRDGSVLPTDAVLVAVGVAPNSQLAEDADLAVDNGVLVDASLRTEDPDIFAVGDVARAYHPKYDKRIRVEHWANALNQPEVAAAAMLGEEAAYTRLPYFFTDQYDLGMEYFGYVEPDGYDALVTRGDPAGGEFIAFWLAGGRVLAGMNVNVWDVGDQIRALIESGQSIDADRLADPNTPLESLVSA
ncbi:NAD(P)/FAD-dependent oxidoreductase [Actinocrinis sp.]|uniref:NAD(P)/FAD-dependent oxidoreductase n=1 Tax=Actinocrinis sp. TaxID=1920516 RepID=UPI002C9B4F9A|nr:FAD-dependent oxidoreductase [Actinocrinis sp.]HXR71450.1 FAD-dependent oxidoreductase [Actinocrinis sp.]